MRMMVNVEVVVDSPEDADYLTNEILATIENELDANFNGYEDVDPPHIRAVYASRDRKREAITNEILRG